MTTANRWTALGLVALMAMMATAPAAARQTNNRIDRLATELELSEAQKSAIAEAAQSEARSQWTMAKALQQNLTSEQKEKFLAQGDRMMAFNRGVQTGRRQAIANQGSGRAARRAAPEGRGRQGEAPQVRTRRPVMDRMIDDLTDDQKAELKALREANQAKMKELRESVRSGDVDRAAVRSQMETLQKSMREEAAAVLTDEQKAKMDQMQDGQRQRARTTSRRTRGSTQVDRPQRTVRTLGRGHSPEAAAEMAEALGLTDAQVELIKIHATLTAAGSMQRARFAQARAGNPRDGNARSGRRSGRGR